MWPVVVNCTRRTGPHYSLRLPFVFWRERVSQRVFMMSSSTIAGRQVRFPIISDNTVIIDSTRPSTIIMAYRPTGQPPTHEYNSLQPAPSDSSSSNMPSPSRMTPSPLPSLPSLSSSSSTALQPGSMSSGSMPSGVVTPRGGSPGLTDRGPDYVYFERKPNQFGQELVQKATAAKMRLELYYKEAVQGVVERMER